MNHLKYILKRIVLMLFTMFIIMTVSFVLIKMLQPETPMMGLQAELERARREALGYYKPVMTQYWIYLKNIVTSWDWGTSWQIDYRVPVTEVLMRRLPPTVIVNVLSLVVSVPLGIALGIFAALKKNKWQDHFISTTIMVFVSVPSFVYAFIVQYFLGFRLGWFPLIASSLHEAGGSWFSPVMLHSLVMPVMALSFSPIASLARSTRAELTESLTSEYMLLARTKGLTRSQATVRHALKNAMVPILPRIISLFAGVIGGSLIIEKIFAINGIGGLFIQAIYQLDYDVFIGTDMFYTAVSLITVLVMDLSYGFLDPRVRMGER